VRILEAGPFYGNEEWPAPNDAPGGEASGDPGDLSGALYDEQFTSKEGEPWDTCGRLSGRELKETMADYRRTLILPAVTT